jgi:hypothetical protein
MAFDLAKYPFPQQWIDKIRTVVEDVVDEKIQPIFTTLQTSIESVDAKTESLKKIVKSKKVFNDGVKLNHEDIYKKVMQNTTIRKVIYMMKYVISTKDGVFVTWPFRTQNDQFIFVTNVNLLKFVAKMLFPKDLSQSDLDNIVFELTQCQIETHVFEDGELEEIRTLFPVEPCKKGKLEDKKYKWFGLRADVLKSLFVALQDQGDVMLKTKTSIPFKEWMKVGRDTGSIETKFNPWKLTPGSRTQVYPTKSKSMIQGKVQWGVEIPLLFFTDDVYKAIQLVTPSSVVPDHCHIGPGWCILYNDPIQTEEYEQFNKPLPSAKKASRKRKRESDDPQSHQSAEQDQIPTMDNCLPDDNLLDVQTQPVLIEQTQPFIAEQTQPITDDFQLLTDQNHNLITDVFTQ